MTTNDLDTSGISFNQLISHLHLLFDLLTILNGFDYLSAPMPLLPSGLQGRRSKRVAAQTNTTDREATLAGDLLLQRSNKLQTELRASDSKGQDDMLWGTTDLDHTDEEGLRFAGYRGQAFFEQLDHDTSGRTMEICVCKHQVSSDGEDVEAEDLMRCSVRDVSRRFSLS